MEKPTRGRFSRKKDDKTKILIAILWTIAICITAFITSSYYYKQKSNEQTKKAELVIGKGLEEGTFDKPIDIVWEGEIISTMVSGADYGIQKIPKDTDYPYFYAYTGGHSNAGFEGTVRVKGQWTGITCAYQNTVFGRCVPEVEVTDIERIDAPVANENDNKGNPAIFHTKEELCQALSPQNPTAEEIKKYNPLFKNPFVKHLRRSLNDFISRKNGTCYSADCFENELGVYDELTKIDADYLKSKFIVLSIDNGLYGGKTMLVLFEDKPDQIFNTWVYDNKDGTYNLLGFSKYDKWGDGSSIDLHKIQQELVNEICSDKFGI